jgi:hypothetical protein
MTEDESRGTPINKFDALLMGEVYCGLLPKQCSHAARGTLVSPNRSERTQMVSILRVGFIVLITVSVFGCAGEPRDLESLVVSGDGVENGVFQVVDPDARAFWRKGSVELTGVLRHHGEFKVGTVSDPTTGDPYSGQVFVVDGPFSWTGAVKHGLLEGPFRMTHSSRGPMVHGDFANGEATGPWNLYREDSGALWWTTEYREGLLDGGYEQFYESGELKIRASYVAGELHGLFEEYRRDGSPLHRGSYVKGQEEGLHEYWPNGGNHRKMTFIGGVLTTCEEYFRDGTLMPPRNPRDFSDYRGCPD